MKKLIIFDMDGTIADTSQGIFKSYRHVAELYGRKIPSNEELKDVIGGSLSTNLLRKLNLQSSEISQALTDYRDYYGKCGYLESKVYPNFKETLSILFEKGHRLSIATMKSDKFAKKLIAEWGLEKYFTSIHGMDEHDSITKPKMIKMCMDDVKYLPDNTVLVGDTIQDMMAANTSKIHFIAATYGFGFQKDECINCKIPFIESPIELIDVIEWI